MSNKEPDWVYIQRTASGEIRFPDGRTVFMQGEEANEFDDKVEACETDEQITNLLMEYEHIAEYEPGKEPKPEETIVRTYREIRKQGYWSQFCYTTGFNLYAISEGLDQDKIVRIPVREAKIIGLIPETY